MPKVTRKWDRAPVEPGRARGSPLPDQPFLSVRPAGRSSHTGMMLIPVGSGRSREVNTQPRGQMPPGTLR